MARFHTGVLVSLIAHERNEKATFPFEDGSEIGLGCVVLISLAVSSVSINEEVPRVQGISSASTNVESGV